MLKIKDGEELIAEYDGEFNFVAGTDVETKQTFEAVADSVVIRPQHGDKVRHVANKFVKAGYDVENIPEAEDEGPEY